MTIISIIAAVARNGVIGRNNALPWYLPEDLKRFRALTIGHHIIMGRLTYKSLGKLLPGRTSVIVSRNADYEVPGAIVVGSLPEAIVACGSDPEVFVIGGASLYQDAISIADRLYLTEIDADFSGDAHFPPYDRNVWQEIARETAQTPEGLRYAYVTYRRR